MRKLFILILACIIIPMIISPAFSSVEWQISQKIQLDTRPLDVAVSLDDKWIFVLNDNGEILIYSKDGTLNDTISVDKNVNEIRVGPRDNLLFLTNSKNKTVEVVEIDFIQNIDITGSPFKGPADAPVTIVLFTDFQ